MMEHNDFTNKKLKLKDSKWGGKILASYEEKEPSKNMKKAIKDKKDKNIDIGCTKEFNKNYDNFVCYNEKDKHCEEKISLKNNLTEYSYGIFKKKCNKSNINLDLIKEYYSKDIKKTDNDKKEKLKYFMKDNKMLGCFAKNNLENIDSCCKNTDEYKYCINFGYNYKISAKCKEKLKNGSKEDLTDCVNNSWKNFENCNEKWFESSDEEFKNCYAESFNKKVSKSNKKVNTKINKKSNFDTTGLDSIYKKSLTVKSDENKKCEKIVCKGSDDNIYSWNHECEIPKNEKCPGKLGDGSYVDKCPISIKGDKRICQPICGDIPKCNQ
jgi:hypothetical protein